MELFHQLVDNVGGSLKADFCLTELLNDIKDGKALVTESTLSVFGYLGITLGHFNSKCNLLIIIYL